MVEFNGFPLPDLDEDSAIHYHNTCISYLVNVSNDSSKSYNEDALAAATILRFYEQVDSKSIDFSDIIKGALSSIVGLGDTVKKTDRSIQPP